MLVDQYKDQEPGASERLSFIYNVPFPPRWGLKKELADSMMKVICIQGHACICIQGHACV